jgi:hypothetical protein
VEVLKSGAARAQSIVDKVMDEVRKKLGIKADWL